MNSAENVTKFLRSRENSRNERLIVANKLLHNDLPIYLPMKELVLLEWALDKLSDQKDSQWRMSPQMWELLVEAWVVCGDSPARKRVAENSPIVWILSKTLNEFTFPCMNLIEPISNAIKSINPVYRTEPVLELFVSLISCIDRIHQETPQASLISFSTLSQALKPLFETLIQAGFVKKKLTSFASVTIPHLLTISTAISDTELSHILSISLDLLWGLPSDELLGLISDAMGGTCSSQSNHLFIKAIVMKIPERERQSFVVRLSKNRKEFMALILNTAKETNVNINAENCAELFTGAVVASDWAAIKLILEYDPTIAARFDDVRESLSSEVQDYREISRLVVVGYGLIRRFAEFLHLWYDLKLNNPEVWSNSLIENQIKVELSSVSDQQISAIFDSSVQRDQVDIVLLTILIQTAILRMQNLSISDSSSMILKDVSLKKVFQLQAGSAEEWHLKYLALILDRSLIAEVTQNDRTNSSTREFSYWCLFRCAELGYQDNFEEHVDKYIKSVDSMQTSELLMLVRRWLPLIDAAFTDKQSKKILKKIIDDSEARLALLTNELFFESSKLHPITLDIILKKVEKGKLNLEEVCKIPIQVFDSERLKKFLALAFDSNVISNDVVCHLLSNSDRLSDLAINATLFESLNFTSCMGIVWHCDAKKLCKVALKSGPDENFNLVIALLKQHPEHEKSPELLTKAMECFRNAVRYLLKNKGDSSKALESVSVFAHEILKHVDDPDREIVSECHEIFQLHVKKGNDHCLRLLFGFLFSKSTTERIMEIFMGIAAFCERNIVVDKDDMTKFLSSITSEEVTSAIEKIFVEVDNVAMCTKLDTLSVIVGGLNVQNHRQCASIIQQIVVLKSASIDDVHTAISLMDCITELVKRPQLIERYFIESTCLIICLMTSKKLNSYQSESLFLRMTELFLTIMVTARWLFNGKIHLLVKILIRLLTCLSLKHKWNCANEATAIAFARAVDNFCNPRKISFGKSSKDPNQLVSLTAAVKLGVGRNVGALLSVYVTLAMTEGFDTAIRTPMRNAIFSILKVMPIERIRMVTSTMNSQERAYFKVLYGEFEKLQKAELYI